MTELRVDVKGMKEFRSSLRGLQNGAQKELRPAWNRVAQLVVDEARAQVPSRSGAARRSLVARSTMSEGRIKAGGANAPYYPWLDFGGGVGRGKRTRRVYIREGRYLYPALRRKRAQIVAAVEHELRQIVRKHGLL